MKITLIKYQVSDLFKLKRLNYLEDTLKSRKLAPYIFTQPSHTPVFSRLPTKKISYEKIKINA